MSAAPRYYLDHNASQPLDPRVRAVMEPFLRSALGNASSLHAEGRQARGAIDTARDRLAKLLKAKPSELVFTSGGTESNNLAVQGLAFAHAARGKHIVTAATEHHAVLHTCHMLEKRHQFEVTYLDPLPDGRIDPARLAATIRPDTILVTIMSANNETGVKNPVAEIGRICAEKKIPFHTDAVQSAGKEPLEIEKWQAAALSITAHKFGGPVGAGLLYLRAGIPISRLMEGGAHENERRPGTENAASIVGLAEAFALAEESRAVNAKREFDLIEQLWREISKLDGVRRNGHPVERIANTLNVSFSGMRGEDLLIGLDLAGLAVSSGSACLVGSVQTSHVLQAMGVPEKEAAATVRFSIGSDLTEKDILEIANRVREVVKRQKSLSAS